MNQQLAVPTRYLQRPRGRLAYDVHGDGPLVVCAPGMGDLRSEYRYLTPRLVESGYRVATMDLRGHGDSDATFDRYDDVASGGDLLALIGELGGPAVVIGNSMSAGAAVWAAAEDPELIGGLVLIGPFVREVPVGRLATVAFRAVMLPPWSSVAWNAYYKRLLPGRPPDDIEEHRARIRASMRRPGHARAFRKTTHASHAPAEARLDDVRAPVLVVMGADDPDFPDPEAEARLIADRLSAQVCLVPGAGHYPQAEYPEIVSPAIVEFLHGLDRPVTSG
jgi:pimeloyl-ACP methyl ester carboxylesterase